MANNKVQLEINGENSYPHTLQNLCVITGTSDMSVTINGIYNHYITVPFNVISLKVGTGIDISGNSIKIIDDDIKNVEISGSVNFDLPTWTNVQMIVEKNGSSIYIVDTGDNGSGMTNNTLPARTYSCSKNDIFTFKVGMSKAGTFNCRRGRSFLSVKEV